MEIRGKHALVTVDYFSGFLTYDTLKSETTETVTQVLNNIFRKFGLPEKIIYDNGPCFRSNDFRRFCDQLDIGHVTSSPYYHQSNGRAERAVATIEQILKKSASDIDITKALTTYLDTPVSDTLPSPAELFHNRRINSRLSMAMTPAPLTDQQKTHLSDKRSAHLKSSKQDNNIYLPSQPIWFTDDSSDEWKPGYIESKDITTDSYWITNDKNNRRLRRNKHDIKPRYITITQQRPKPQIPVRYPADLSDDDAASAIPEVQEPTACDGTMVLLPFVTSFLLMIKDVFRTLLKHKKKLSKKCLNERDLVNCARFICEKPIRLTGKIAGKSSRPTTCHFLLKKFTSFSVFWETFTP